MGKSHDTSGAPYLQKLGFSGSEFDSELCKRCDENYRFVRNITKDLAMLKNGISAETRIALEDELSIYEDGMKYVKEDIEKKYSKNKKVLEVCREHYKQRIDYINELKK